MRVNQCLRGSTGAGKSHSRLHDRDFDSIQKTTPKHIRTAGIFFDVLTAIQKRLDLHRQSTNQPYIRMRFIDFGLIQEACSCSN